MSDSASVDSDKSFYTQDSIFANRELVEVGHVPSIDRVVGRDDYLERMGHALSPAARGDPARNVVMYGETGSGKSLVARCFGRYIKNIAHEEEDTNMQYAYVDCSESTTDAQASCELTREIYNAVGQPEDVNIPDQGISGSKYRRKMYRMLNDHNVESCIVILDEIDLLDGNELLRSLSRAKESNKTDTNLGIVAISNKPRYPDNLDERTDSSFQCDELFFDSYDANQLREILYAREDAFKDGALSDDVIPLTAAECAQSEGDARVAVDTLFVAGDLAERANDSQVTEDHVRKALEQAEVNRIQELISGIPEQRKHVLWALATLNQSRDSEWFKTSEVYKAYEELGKPESRHYKVKGERQVQRHLRKLAFLQVIESDETGGGFKEGRYVEHHLLGEPEKVKMAIQSS